MAAVLTGPNLLRAPARGSCLWRREPSSRVARHSGDMVAGSGTRTASPRQGRLWLAVGAMVLNSALLGAMCVLSFDPQRRAFGRATGLWHPCEIALVAGHGVERWSPALLVLLVPATVGLSSASWLSRPWVTGLRVVSALLGLIAVLLVIVPTGSCVA